MQTKSWGPFSGRQLTTIVALLCATVVLFPGAVWAVDAFSNVAIQDPVSGTKAGVDANRRLQVSDGSGALTVDGTTAGYPTRHSKYFLVRQFSTINGTVRQSATGFAITSITVTNNHTASGRATFYYNRTCNAGLQLLDIDVPAKQTVHMPFPQVMLIPPLPGCSTVPYLSVTGTENLNLTMIGYDL